MRLTSKQIEIMQKIKEGNADGSLIDITQLRHALSYAATKQAVLCSVNVLINRSLVARAARETRGGRVHTTVELTALGEAHIESYVKSLKSVLVEDEEDPDV